MTYKLSVRGTNKTIYTLAIFVVSNFFFFANYKTFCLVMSVGLGTLKSIPLSVPNLTCPYMGRGQGIAMIWSPATEHLDQA